MNKKLLIILIFLLIISLLSTSQQKDYKVVSVSGNEITINAGSNDGVKKGFTGRTYKESQYEGKTVPIYTAKFEVISVANDSCKAKIAAQTAAIMKNQKVEFNQKLTASSQSNKQVVAPEVTYEPHYGSLEIDLNVNGAKVYLDGKYQGTTREGYAFVIKKLLTGNHSIKIAKDKYKNYETTVRVSKGKRASLAVKLEPTGPSLPAGMRFLHRNQFGYIEVLNEKDNSEMVLIPAGEFLMGSPLGEGDDDEHPQHKVYLDAFFIDKYEVTNAQYEKFIKETKYKTNGLWRNYYSYGKENHPVVNVSWNDAVAYARWAEKRLPTEAQWEKAARGGLEGKKYPWGDEINKSRANYADSGYRTTQPVGSYPANGYGLFDMSGNVREWCSDWYDNEYYKLSVKRNPKGPITGFNRILKGGSWINSAEYLRITYRTRNIPDIYLTFNGFRCTRDAQ
jgi:formylglycine-generating enzyme required for sulfatase activity